MDVAAQQEPYVDLAAQQESLLLLDVPILQRHVLHRDQARQMPIYTPQVPELRLDVSGEQEPVLVWTHIHLQYTRGALAAPGRVYTSEAIVAPGRVYSLHHRGLSCTWTCLHQRGSCCSVQQEP